MNNMNDQTQGGGTQATEQPQTSPIDTGNQAATETTSPIDTGNQKTTKTSYHESW